MRTIDAVHRADAVADADLKRVADAARRISGHRDKLSAEQSAVIGWLVLGHARRGLARLAMGLGFDKSNLLKVIWARRKPSKALMAEVKGLIGTTGASG